MHIFITPRFPTRFRYTYNSTIPSRRLRTSSMPTKFSNGENGEELDAELKKLLNEGWSLDKSESGIEKTYHFKTYTKVLVRNSKEDLFSFFFFISNDFRTLIIRSEFDANRETTTRPWPAYEPSFPRRYLMAYRLAERRISLRTLDYTSPRRFIKQGHNDGEILWWSCGWDWNRETERSPKMRPQIVTDMNGLQGRSLSFQNGGWIVHIESFREM